MSKLNSHNTVFGFSGLYDFLAPSFPESTPVLVGDTPYYSVEHVYYSKLLAKEADKLAVSCMYEIDKVREFIKTKDLIKGHRNVKDVQKIMYALLKRKHTDDPHLKLCLDRTMNLKLLNILEYHDEFWGIYEGIGENIIGQMLEHIRERNREKIRKKTILGFYEETGFLSNFYYLERPIIHKGIEYPTSEHMYQALKTTDMKERARIAGASSPAKAKWLGRKAKCREDWDKVKDPIMLGILKAKFDKKKRSKTARKLIDTRNVYLEETNTWNDTYWGRNVQGYGQNKLGLALMETRLAII